MQGGAVAPALATRGRPESTDVPDPSEGTGISDGDISALESLSGASLEVTYKKLPRARRGQG